MAMLAFGVKNLRCLTETGLIPIKPITLLVGRNSSGKSTYLRAFPLLKQSVLTTRSSPILWFHDDYVDFGSISHAIRKQANPRTVTFEFLVNTSEGHAIPDATNNVALELREHEGATEIAAIVHQLPGANLRVEVDHDGNVVCYKVNDSPVEMVNSAPDRLAGPTCLIPRLGWTNEPRVTFPRYAPGDDDSRIGHAARSLLGSRYRRDLSELSLGFTSENIAEVISTIFAMTDHEVANFMSGVAYLAPQRAKGERQSRIQDLGVDEIDPQGNNLAMFLKSLTPTEMASLGEFTQKHLGFVPSVRVDRLQVEILIREPHSDEAINLVDVGFGYSQVLPLVAILWSTCIREPVAKLRRPTLLALEQPELHLHPAFQAKLASMFADAMATSRDRGHMVPLMIETHSEALISQLGEIVETGGLQPSDVSVLLFEQDPQTGTTSIKQSQFDSDGVLTNWPIGFFAP